MECPFAHSESELREQPSLQATGLCYEFARGHCRKGGACNFAHGKHELRSLPAPTQKMVPAKGGACNFAHGKHEFRSVSAASVASAYDQIPQNTGLDPRMMQGMVKQLHELEKMVANMILELQMAGPGHGLQPAPNPGDHVTGSQRFQNGLESMWLWGISTPATLAFQAFQVADNSRFLCSLSRQLMRSTAGHIFGYVSCAHRSPPDFTIQQTTPSRI